VPSARDWTKLGEDTPLGGYRQYTDGPAYDFDGHLQTVVEATAAREELVAACMKDAGFDYTPVPYAGPREPDESRYPWVWQLRVPELAADRETVATWGYGLDGEASDQALEPPGADPKASEAMAENLEYQESLGVAARAEYDLALFGPVDADGIPLNESDGCMSGAYARVPAVSSWPPEVKTFIAEYEDMIIDMTDVWRWDVTMDPAAVALDGEWERCVTAKGVDFAGLVFGYGDEDWEIFVAAEGRPSPASAMRAARLLDADGALIGEDSDEERSLRAYPAQVEVALADFDCREELGYMDRMMEIVAQAEQRFLDENRDQLEAMKAAATEQR
jgi:hypothetical protein